MAGDVFLEKKARLRWLGASFSRKRLDSDGWGRISREKTRLRWLGAYNGEPQMRANKQSHGKKLERIPRKDFQKVMSAMLTREYFRK